MKARLLSFTLLLPVALGLIGKCTAMPPAPVHFRAGSQAEDPGGAGDGAFSEAVSFTGGSFHAGRSAISIVSGDFNGDGIPDFVIGQSAFFPGAGVTVFLGRIGGSLGKGAVYAAGHATGYVAVGDINHDGKLDIIATNAVTGSLEILMGKGDGTFREPVSIPLPDIPRGVVAGDFNGDGWVDVAVVGSTGKVYVLLNDRKGSLRAATAYSLSGRAFELVAADVNGDGKIDLCMAMSDTSRVAILLGKGDGTFASAGDYETTVASPYGIAVADVDHDGKADLVITSPATGKIVVARGNGDGTFNSPTVYAAGVSTLMASAPVDMALADVNGDGYPDIVYANAESSTVGVLLNDGDGEFYGPAEFHAESGAVAVTIADLNQDGWLDVVAAGSYAGRVAVLYNATGAAGLPAARFSTGGLAFGHQQVGVTSGRQTLTLANTGGSTLHIGSIDVAGADGSDFLEHNNCGTKLPAGGSCKINVNFTPSALGPRSASVVVTDDAVGSPHSAPLSGTGGTAIGRVTPGTVAFGGQVVNSTSSPKTVTLLNNGTIAMNISSVATTGDFAIQTNGCGSELDPGVSCNVAVVFTPTQLGTRTGTLTFVDDASNSPQTANLNGTGQTNTTSTKLTANPNPVVVGHVLTLTAHVTPTFKGTPTGTVTFYDGATVLGTATLVSGVAQFTTSSMTAGSHSLTAVYGGDAVFQGSTSAVVTEQVNQEIATVNVMTSATPVYILQNIIFTATVSADGGVVATGTMTFQQGTTSLGTMPLVNGQASITESFSVAGTYRVTASYSGDQNYKANSSFVNEEVWWIP